MWLTVTVFSISLLAQIAESPDGQEVSTEVTPVPPFAYSVQGLKHSTNYSVRVRCSNEMGSSPFTDRVYFQTPELGKQIADRNRKAVLILKKRQWNCTELLLPNSEMQEVLYWPIAHSKGLLTKQ